MLEKLQASGTKNQGWQEGAKLCTERKITACLRRVPGRLGAALVAAHPAQECSKANSAAAFLRLALRMCRLYELSSPRISCLSAKAAPQSCARNLMMVKTCSREWGTSKYYGCYAAFQEELDRVLPDLASASRSGIVTALRAVQFGALRYSPARCLAKTREHTLFN